MLRHCFVGIMVLVTLQTSGNTWEQTLSQKSGQLDLYWNNSTPFIYVNDKGNLTGIEFEIMNSFRDFLLRKYKVDLTLNWKEETKAFLDIFEIMKDTIVSNQFGMAAISITQARQEIVQFSDPYFPDVAVLVSSQGTPIVHETEEIIQMLKNMVAVTIKGTNYERLLLNLQKDSDIDFEIKYIESHLNILASIRQAPNQFGYVDLPIYLMLIRDGSELTRQNLFTVRGTGYGIIMPKGSDWSKPFNEFLYDPVYRQEIAMIISKYLGSELFEFIDSLFDRDQMGTSILTKEKEIQLEHIKNVNLRLEEERKVRQLLIVGIIVSSALLLIIGILFYNKQKTAALLQRQKNLIETQKDDIGIKNEQLINRNAQLISLNEEKNNLVRILAHDLRSPLNQVIGLTKVLPERIDMKAEDKQLLDEIGEGTERINQMIAKILDVDGLEGNQILVLKECVDVNHIMQDVASHYRETAAKKEIDIVLEFCEENCTFETDHLLLFLVLENLVSNAIKFSPKQTEVTLTATCQDDTVIFKISDHGPGFTDQDKKLLYNRFQKLSAEPTGDESSTGLGLSIVKKYTDDIGGEVWLESEHGKGSTFFVALPA